ncbi:MAG TPA: HDOD domain-containing protein [Phycisphaerae bacterium]|nr:HDOD domain-containing protein [Phycisphaerae bacterium]
MLSFIRQCITYLFTEPAEPPTPVRAQTDDVPADAEQASALAEQALEQDFPQPELAWWIPDPSRLEPPLPQAKQQAVDRALYDQLTKALDDQNLDLPRMPHVAQRALLALRDENVNYPELAELIGQDPVLSAEILRVANSVLFRAVREVTQLEQAFTRLGQRHVRSCILGVSFKGITIRIGGAERSIGEELWRRSMVAGVVLRQFAPRFGLPEEEAFLVGLLHDIGMLVVLKVTHEYQQLHGRPVPRSLFDQVADEWHQHVGLRLAEAWNLPDPLPELIGTHHSQVREGDPRRTYRLLIQLADVACEMLGYSPYQAHDFFSLPCVTQLNLKNDADTRRLLSEIPRLLPDLVPAPR